MIAAVIINRRIPLYWQARLYPGLRIQFRGRSAIFAQRYLPGWSRTFLAPEDKETA